MKKIHEVSYNTYATAQCYIFECNANKILLKRYQPRILIWTFKKNQGEKIQNLTNKLDKSRKKLMVLSNFEIQVTNYLSNEHKAPYFSHNL